jgi:hypothetical protein
VGERELARSAGHRDNLMTGIESLPDKHVPGATVSPENTNTHCGLPFLSYLSAAPSTPLQDLS